MSNYQKTEERARLQDGDWSFLRFFLSFRRNWLESSTTGPLWGKSVPFRRLSLRKWLENSSARTWDYICISFERLSAKFPISCCKTNKIQHWSGITKPRYTRRDRLLVFIQLSKRRKRQMKIVPKWKMVDTYSLFLFAPAIYSRWKLRQLVQRALAFNLEMEFFFGSTHFSVVWIQFQICWKVDQARQ